MWQCNKILSIFIHDRIIILYVIVQWNYIWSHNTFYVTKSKMNTRSCNTKNLYIEIEEGSVFFFCRNVVFTIWFLHQSLKVVSILLSNFFTFFCFFIVKFDTFLLLNTFEIWILYVILFALQLYLISKNRFWMPILSLI